MPLILKLLLKNPAKDIPHSTYHHSYKNGRHMINFFNKETKFSFLRLAYPQNEAVNPTLGGHKSHTKS